MKLATYSVNGQPTTGVVVDHDRAVIDLAAADRALAAREGRAPHAFFSDMIALLTAGDQGLAAARAAVAAAGPEARLSIANVTLLAPVPRPPKVLCLAGNYQDHIEEEGSKMSEADTETPRIFDKPPTTTIIGCGSPILIPPVAHAIDWEGELAVIIGKRCKGVAAANALDYVAGYTIMNDVSERKFKIKERKNSRPRDEWFDWLNGKWFDTSAPLGPWIVTTDEITDPHTLEISTFVNGERKQHNFTKMMIYRVPETIAYVAAFMTLEPGDVISTGTISGVGASSGTFLQPGDQVKVEITCIGALENPVEREA